MNIDTRVKLPEEKDIRALKKLLGSLLQEVMGCMWQAEEDTVQQVTKVIDCKRIYCLYHGDDCYGTLGG